MREIANDIVSTLIRCLPIILENMDAEAMRKNLRLYNAVRLTKKVNQRLIRIENEQKSNYS